MHYDLRATLAATLLLCVISCDGSDVARIEVARRHIVLYGHSPFTLPIRLLDRAGNVLPPRDVTLRVSPDSAVRFILPDAIVCERAGSADVEVRAGALTEHLDVQCRPGAVIGVVPFAERVEGDSPQQVKFEVELAVGDPPRPLTFEATLPSGDREVVRPFRVELMDSSVAYLRADSIVPVSPGRRLIQVELGGQWVFVTVAVSAVIENDTLSLVAGQVRSWSLVPGRYSLTVATVPARPAARWLDMVTAGVHCIRDLRAEDTIHCVVYQHGTVVVRNLSADPRGPAKRAFVRIVRRP